ERWPRLRHAQIGTEEKGVADLLPLIHERFQSTRAQSGDDAVAALGSATNTNEALFLMKKYFKGRMDFRIGREVELYEQRQDDLLRRLTSIPTRTARSISG